MILTNYVVIVTLKIDTNISIIYDDCTRKTRKSTLRFIHCNVYPSSLLKIVGMNGFASEVDVSSFCKF